MIVGFTLEFIRHVFQHIEKKSQILPARSSNTSHNTRGNVDTARMILIYYLTETSRHIHTQTYAKYCNRSLIIIEVKVWNNPDIDLKSYCPARLHQQNITLVHMKIRRDTDLVSKYLKEVHLWHTPPFFYFLTTQWFHTVTQSISTCISLWAKPLNNQQVHNQKCCRYLLTFKPKVLKVK